MNQPLREHPYASFVHRVEKPARYLGGEFNAVRKDWDAVDCRFCLCFPDVYDIGMSHMGTKILYSIVNKTDDLLMERCFAPWFDMEAELRARDLPLLSLESHLPLSAFDVIGFSLQYEMTYTNVLTMLDLGGVPLLSADRTLEHPLVIAGGPSATHPEPIADFIDVFVIGDAEERLTRLLRHYAQLRATPGLTRQDMLAALASEGGVYVPALYALEIEPRTGLQVVGAPLRPEVPARVERAFLDDISRYRFPDDSPVAVAEAIFDRMSVEIARGCTEGCRFCQAGMIYRPVRERDPQEIIDTVISAIDKGGYDEASITALSTADFSCISPLIKQLMEKLRERKVSLGISSLRAYGLSDDLLDEIASVKATGLTFAPEAGTQRMRDVINKNVSEDDIFATCHRVFSKGWKKMKLYFILGLPTETDEDIEGIARMGRQAREIGDHYQRAVTVTVSVSSHVPKPHTPFQWAAMDSLAEIDRKQQTLFDLSRAWRFRFRRHDARVSHLECITGRGDRRVGKILLEAWRGGARFDGWDEHLNWAAWQTAIANWEAETGFDRGLFFGTLPVDARLPWDHIDVGLEDGFLLREYRKALANRLSPPCGKPMGAKVHHTNLQDARADERKLVCHHCGIACDMTGMAQERLDFLQDLGAELPPVARLQNHRDEALDRLARGLTPHDFQQGTAVRYRVRYTKVGPFRLQGHLDVVRDLPRILRRAGFDVRYSEGFSPRPQMTFGPALTMGARSSGEYVDVILNHEVTPDALMRGLNGASPDGLFVTGVRRLHKGDPGLSHALQAYDFLVTLDPAAFDVPAAQIVARMQDRIDVLRQQPDAVYQPQRGKKSRPRRVWDVVVDIRATTSDLLPTSVDVREGLPALWFRLNVQDGGSMKPAEVLQWLLGDDAIVPRDTVRLTGWALRETLEVPAPPSDDVEQIEHAALSDASEEAPADEPPATVSIQVPLPAPQDPLTWNAAAADLCEVSVEVARAQHTSPTAPLVPVQPPDLLAIAMRG